MEGEELMKKAEEFLESRKYSNNLIDILENEDEKLVNEQICALEIIFVDVLNKRTMFLHCSSESPQDDTASKYVSWLRQCYEKCWTIILKFVSKGKKQASSTLLKLLAEEGKHPIFIPPKGKYFFPEKHLQDFMRLSIIEVANNRSLVKYVDKYTDYIDVVYYMWLNLPRILEIVEPCDVDKIRNALTFIENLPLPTQEEVDTDEPDVILCYVKNRPKFRPNYAEIQKSVTMCWDVMRKWRHNDETQTMLLNSFLDKMLPNMSKPTLTLDYLMECTNKGGAVALLALEAVFRLVRDHNLEHPNIFAALYSLFKPDIFSVEHRIRLYNLTDCFMSSTHLPEALVASFMKRMARLCLSAPPEDIIVMVLLIKNFMIRHPTLKKLIHHLSGGSVASDPFLEEESDPMKTNAIQSSLWELETLQSHVLPKVSNAVSFINKPLPSVESNLPKWVGNGYDEMFERESAKKIQNVSITFEKPYSLSVPRSNYFTNYWSFTD